MTSVSMKLPVDSCETDSTPVTSLLAWPKALLKLGTAARLWSNPESCGESSCGSGDEAAVSSGTSGYVASDDSDAPVFSASALLKFRFFAATDDADHDVHAEICKAKLQPLTYESMPTPKSKVVAPVRRHQMVQPLTPTAGSWSAQQRSTPGSNKFDDTEKVSRTARSILNKIASDTFEPLLEQLVTCGIERSEHLCILMREVFDMATKQHNFIPMYADICERLEKDIRITAVVEVAGHQHNFRRLLLNQCQVVFEQLMESRPAEEALDEEAALRRKQEALGNIKLIGHLLVKGMLSSKMLVECAEELIGKRATCPEALESLTALMLVAAPTFDTKQWQYHGKLTSVFDTMRKLSKDKSTVPRSRFLIRDVLDLRDAGWPNSIKNPSVIRSEQDSKAMLTVDQTGTSSVADCQVVKPNVVSVKAAVFDLKIFRRSLAATLSDLTSDRNVSAAVNRVRLLQVPLDCQAEQFADIIIRVVEEKRGPPRRCAMAFAAGLASGEESAFDRDQCLAGIANFFQDVYPDLCNEVPRLPAIVRSEFTPTFCSVFPKAEISKCLPPGVRF